MQAAQNTAQIFLGVNLKCNSCHDSFISKWKLKDAYSLAAYFSTEEKLQLYRCDIGQQTMGDAAFLFPELNRAPARGLPTGTRAAAAIFTDPRNGRLARTVVNRIWHRLLGRGIVENPDEMDGEPWSPELLDWLSADFVEHGYDLKRLIGTIVSSRTYQMPASAERYHGTCCGRGGSRRSSSPTPSRRSPAIGTFIKPVQRPAASTPANGTSRRIR